MLLLSTTLFAMLSAVEPGQPILLWPARTGVPAEAVRTTDAGDRVVSSVHNPAITPYLPSNPNGLAVVIAPGGGHRELWTSHEGHNIARWLSDHGVAAFVLYYRLAREKDSKYTIEGESLSDTLRAIAMVRDKAAAYKVDPAKIGVMGFSAGGELAALAAVKFTKPQERPNFQALIYPAIPKEMTLSKDTPPAFLACGENDRQNISQGLPELYVQMKKAGMSAELHVYAGVGHGFGIRPTLKGPVKSWIERFNEWMLATAPFKNENSVTSSK